MRSDPAFGGTVAPSFCARWVGGITRPERAICAPMMESLESLPLPDHPLLATWASALNDAGYWATLMDAEWRIVFVTDETLLTYRDMGAATPPPIGAHFLSAEWREFNEITDMSWVPAVPADEGHPHVHA